MTDAVGKAFENLYHGKNIMSQMFDKYWHVVSGYFHAVDGILAYELLNEPWIGDYIKHPDLLLKAGSAEKLNVGVYMKRAHAKVRENDKETPVLFSPAELNNRAFRKGDILDDFWLANQWHSMYIAWLVQMEMARIIRSKLL